MSREKQLARYRCMRYLSKDQYERFWADGYLMIEQAVNDELLQRLRHDFDAWVEESRAHREAYGATIDGRPRFDLETGHSART